MFTEGFYFGLGFLAADMILILLIGLCLLIIRIKNKAQRRREILKEIHDHPPIAPDHPPWKPLNRKS